MALSLLKAGLTSRLSKLKHMFKEEESETVALKIPMARCSEFLVKLQDFLIKEEGVQSIAKEPNQLSFDNRILLLNKSVDLDLSQLPTELKQWVESQNVEVLKFGIVKGLGTFSLDEALQKLLKNEDGKVNPRIKIETLKQFKIIELTDQQQKFKEEIAQIVMNKGGNGTQAVLEKVNVATNQPFISYKYQQLCGVTNSKLELKEGSCSITFNPTQVYIDNFAQEEREALIGSVKTSANVVDLFGNIILDNRLAKERSAHLKIFLRSNEQAAIFHDAYAFNSNVQQYKSIGTNVLQKSYFVLILFKGSLSQQSQQPQGSNNPSTSGTCSKTSGSLETETGDVYEYLQRLQASKFNYEIVIISEILQDISFICSFVGLGQAQNDISVFFQLLVSDEQYDSKSIQELIITRLNDQVNLFSKQSNNENLFDKSDLVSVSATKLEQSSFSEDSQNAIKKRTLLNINLKIRKEVLSFSEYLIAQVKQHFHHQNIIHQSPDISETEPVLSKKFKISNEAL